MYSFADILDISEANSCAVLPFFLYSRKHTMYPFLYQRLPKLLHKVIKSEVYTNVSAQSDGISKG